MTATAIPSERTAHSFTATSPKPYISPYMSGIGIGVVLLAAFVIMGRGLGASGAFSTVVASGVATVAPEHAAARRPYAGYLTDGNTNPFDDWLVIEILGVFLGGVVSATLAGRFRPSIERGPNISNRGRLIHAFLGGTVMGIGAKIARGCTSGQALTGGALLSVGSWLFVLGAFGAGYLAAPLFRRQWI